MVEQRAARGAPPHLLARIKPGRGQDCNRWLRAGNALSRDLPMATGKQTAAVWH